MPTNKPVSAATRPVALALNGGRVCEGFRAALFDAAGREGKSVNELVLEAAGRGLRAAGYDFSGRVPKPRGIEHAGQGASVETTR